MVLSTNDNPQLGKSREDYSRLASLLENTKDQILGYFPSGIHPATLGDQQLEYEVYNELTTLFTLARDFSGSFRKAHQDDIRSAVQSHPIDLAVSTDREEYDSWADELDARGVELWNRASQLRRILDSQRSSKPDYIELNKIYHSALRLLHQKNSSQSPLITSKNKKHQEPLLSEKICAKMRQLGFTMIYAGSPVKKDTALLLKLVSLSSKSSKAQLMVYDLESAMKNIETAWELEQQLQEIQSNPDNSTITKDKDFICTMLTFYSIKADCARNETATLFNLRKALALFPKTTDERQPAEALDVISRLYTFAYELLKPKSQKSQRGEKDSQKLPVLIKASQWLTLALNELDSHSWHTAPEEPGDTGIDAPGSTSELKVKIIRALAYSFLEAASFGSNDQHELQRKGEQALEEALNNRPSQALWLRKIQLLSQRKRMGSELRTAVKEALKTVPFNQELINKLMVISHKLSDDRLVKIERSIICAEIFSACVVKEDPIERCLGDPAFYTIILASSASKGPNGRRNQNKSAPNVFTNIPQNEPSEESKFQFLKDTADHAMLANSEFRLASDCAFMSQTMIWHRGDQEYKKMRFDLAARWYTFGTHAVFVETKEATFAKLARKAALSWVNHGNYELARNSLKNLPPQGYNEAGTHFLAFMIDSAQGNELPAIQSIDRLMSSLDFKPETLLYAAQQANHRGLQNLLHHILQKTLEATSGATGTHFIQGLDMVILLRSLIRIDLSNLSVPHRNRANDEQRILQHYRAAKEMLIQSQEASAIQVSSKDATWLWKTAFNTCVSATHDWPEDLVFEFFGLTADLISLTRKIPTSIEEVQTLTRHEIHCRFACLAGSMTQALNTDRDDYRRKNLEQPLLASIKQLKKLSQGAQDIASDGAFSEKLGKIRACLCVWEFETYSMGNDWEAIRYFIEDLELGQESQAFISTQVTESIAEIACQNHSLPTELLIFVLEHVMKIVDRQREKSIDARSRWLRLVIDLELSINSDEGALRFSNQALQLMQKYPEEYPSDEANWILAKSWDRSIDLYSSQNIIQSKLWCEMSLKWMELVIGGRAYEDMMNRHYRDLLKLTATLDTHQELL
ncbi:hypothetical protein PtA15_17A386 [Puccinia triticina]|uniref:Protein ZIP4 homolog n=1 Tax=Puccinia triticina TaxID=208348 RepID=A0ABY7D809_9BASI|nr:uncharacterized protein PtA15_17A386 [Puccinia triticina]WAQ92904.1 hypothetical protein PtA15_17A386 [Puccinia triticina]